MKEKSIGKNYIYNVSCQVLTLLMPLITTPYLSRVLGPAGIGQVSFAESVVSCFALFAVMGVSAWGQREISYVQADRKARSAVFWNAKLLQLVISGGVLAVYLGFVLAWGGGPLYWVLALNLAAVLADVTWFFQGMEEFGKIAARSALSKLAQVAYVFLAVKTREDVVLYALGHALFPLLGNLSLLPWLKGSVEPVARAQLQPFRDFRAVLGLFAPTIAIQIYTVLDKTMLGIIAADPWESGYYEQAVKLVRMTLVLVTAMGTAAMPRVGSCVQKQDREAVLRLLYRGYRFVWVLGIPLCLGLAAVAGNFVPWFFGPEYAPVTELLRVLALLIPAIGISNVTGIQYLVPAKRERLLTLTVLAGAWVNMVCNALLIRPFGAMGAAAASVAAEVVIAAVQLFAVRRELNPGKILLSGIPFWVAGGVMYAAVRFAGKVLPATPLHTFGLVALGAAIYGGILLGYFLLRRKGHV